MWKLTARDQGTRLVTRLRILYRWHMPTDALMSLVHNEFGGFPMMRMMLRTIKQRASRRGAPMRCRMHERYTAAVIGGGVGGKLSAAALAAADRFELVALADLRTEARAECAARYPGIATYATHQELFARHILDVVCVATYPPTHLPIARDALGLPLAGLLVEKPLGDTYAAGSAIVAQA